MRIVDLFCGIGGVAEAARDLREQLGTDRLEDAPTAAVVAAIDIDRRVSSVYAANHGITPRCQTLESVRDIPDADLWWLSPPCQPYTRRGRGLAEHDPRSQAMAHLIDLIARDRPAMVALENVPAFADSAHHKRLLQILRAAGYSVQDDLLCPSRWGVPMRRNRFYLRARRDGGMIPHLEVEMPPQPLRTYLDESAWTDRSLHLSPMPYRAYQAAMDVVDIDDPDATAACFTSAYGKSPVRAGSYVRCRKRGITRRFSPSEITQLMGFRRKFYWPGDLDTRARYALLGNSLSVSVVRCLLESLL